MISIAIFTSILLAAFYNPMIGIALISHVYLIRSLTSLNSFSLCYTGDCAIESDPIFGMALPLLVFALIIIRTFFTKSAKLTSYKISFIDWLLVFYIFIMLLGCLYSKDIEESLIYFSKFLLLGTSFFFVTNFYLQNSTNYVRDLRYFFITSLCTSFILSLIALYYFINSNALSVRLTLPGVHPIPFSLMIGYAFLISIIIFFSKKNFLEIKSKIFFKANTFLGIYFFLIQLATNTRGVTIAMMVALLFTLYINRRKIRITHILISIPIGLGIIIYAIFKIGSDVLFNRFAYINEDQSVSERWVAYNDSLEMFAKNLFGVGTDNYQYFSSINTGYPHNFLLENLASFGILGLIINIGFLLIFIFFMIKIINEKYKNNFLNMFYILAIFFFIETMFSFTIWMHKGLYLHLALLASYNFITKRAENVT